VKQHGALQLVRVQGDLGEDLLGTIACRTEHCPPPAMRTAVRWTLLDGGPHHLVDGAGGDVKVLT
jgi:hypothetical protein